MTNRRVGLGLLALIFGLRAQQETLGHACRALGGQTGGAFLRPLVLHQQEAAKPGAGREAAAGSVAVVIGSH